MFCCVVKQLGGGNCIEHSRGREKYSTTSLQLYNSVSHTSCVFYRRTERNQSFSICLKTDKQILFVIMKKNICISGPQCSVFIPLFHFKADEVIVVNMFHKLNRPCHGFGFGHLALTSRQTCDKLQCLYKNLMYNFRKMALLKKKNVNCKLKFHS